MPEIKERPILFSASMVRAILEGRKTVTRREVKKRAALDCLAAGFEPAFLTLPGNADLCPYGKQGDRLWVRETHSFVPDPEEPAGYSQVLYAADGQQYGKNRPSIHMFRCDSRILLEITDVRVERLQDISEDQAKAEGCFFTDYGQVCFHGGRGIRDATECEYPASKHQQRPGWMWDKTPSHEHCLDSARNAFGNLWQSVGGDWSANPWVWVVEFKRVTP